VPAGRARGNLMLCFWFTHVSGIHPLLVETMIDGRCDDNPDFREPGSKRGLNDVKCASLPPSCSVPVFVRDAGGSRISFARKASARNVR
jgi:hypothetical protein